MATTLNAVSGTGLVQTSDGSGVVKVQSNGVTTNALAWVNFAGASGTRNASYNVSSVTRTTTGQYVVNFATALADANYTWSVNMYGVGASNGYYMGSSGTPSTTALPIITISTNAVYADPTAVVVTVFGN